MVNLTEKEYMTIKYELKNRRITQYSQTKAESRLKDGYNGALLCAMSMIRGRYKYNHYNHSELISAIHNKLANYSYETPYCEGFHKGMNEVIDILEKRRVAYE